MALSTRQELIDYCLRRLGFPVIEINVDEDQVNDRIDDAGGLNSGKAYIYSLYA